MKKIALLGVLLLVASLGFAQQNVTNLGIYDLATPAYMVKAYSNYTATSDDTTGTITWGTYPILFNSEVYLVGVATDTIQAAVYVIGSNRDLPYVKVVHTDSISSITHYYTDAAITATNPVVHVITLKNQTINVLGGCTDFKIGDVFTAYEGTTSGRTMKWYVVVRK